MLTALKSFGVAFFSCFCWASTALALVESKVQVEANGEQVVRLAKVAGPPWTVVIIMVGFFGLATIVMLLLLLRSFNPTNISKAFSQQTVQVAKIFQQSMIDHTRAVGNKLEDQKRLLESQGRHFAEQTQQYYQISTGLHQAISKNSEVLEQLTKTVGEMHTNVQECHAYTEECKSADRKELTERIKGLETTLEKIAVL